ncbi:hypothetical protein Spb1_03510 [Planctopirus ephydatiae]|uniref:Uncharacterized protein n=1 Tax=Planctopirus ephydatiae TaxID=2528019 RepID=A0A518GIS4_9PLAN|nr:hypothetical protein Spb1_03510 [Planctopirus ephydatiae]
MNITDNSSGPGDSRNRPGHLAFMIRGLSLLQFGQWQVERLGDGGIRHLARMNVDRPV